MSDTATASYAPSAPIPFTDLSVDDQRMWGTIIHAIGLAFGVAGAWFMYLTLRNRGGLIRSHTAAELNIALTYAIGLLIAAPLAFIPIVNILVWLVVAAASIARFVFVIISAMKAYGGVPYNVPGAIRFVR